MESELQRPHGHNFDEDPHNTGSYSVIDQGGDEQHQEKKSVLKKVKAKAKKIKDTLTKHGHGHDHEHDEEEEDDEGEEMVEGPKVHAFGSVAGGRSGVPRQGVVNLEKPTGSVEDRSDSKMVDARPRGNLVHSQADQYMGQPRVNIGRETGMEEDPHAPKDRNDTSFPPNYQTKVADPTNASGEEAGITQILRSFNNMGVYDEPEPKSKPGPEGPEGTGSHDQFAPEPVPKAYDPSKLDDMPLDTLTGKPSSDQSSYTEKLSSATTAIADKAISAKNAVASKLGYGGNEQTGSQEMHGGGGGGGGDAAKLASPTEYAQNIAVTVTEKLAPVYEKVSDAGSSVMSKIHDGSEGTSKGPDKGVSVKEYWAERLKPGEEDRALSDAISQAFHKRKEESEKAGEVKPMGKVTESKEVASRLGTGNEGSAGGINTGAAGDLSAGKGVVDRVKGAVSSWLGKGGESQTSQASLGTSYVGNEGNATDNVGEGNATDKVGEGRRLEESSK